MAIQPIVTEAMNLFLASPTARGKSGGAAIAGLAKRCMAHLLVEWHEDDISHEPFERVPGAPYGRSAIYWYQKICKADIRINANLIHNLIDISLVMAHESAHHANAELSYFEQELWCQVLSIWYYWDFVAATRTPAKRWSYWGADGRAKLSPILPPIPTAKQASCAYVVNEYYMKNRMIDYVVSTDFYKKHLKLADIRKYFYLYGGPANRTFATAGTFIKHLAKIPRFDDAVKIMQLLEGTMHNSHAFLASAAREPWKTQQMRDGFALLVYEAGGIEAIRKALSIIIVPYYRQKIEGIGRYWGVQLLN